MTQTWTREGTWDWWLSPTDFVQAAWHTEHLIERHVEAAHFSAVTETRDLKSTIRSDSIDALNEVLSSYEPASLKRTRWTFLDQDAKSELVKLEAEVEVHLVMDRWVDQRLHLSVTGTDRTTVEGVFAQLDEYVDLRVTRDQQAAAEQAAEEEAARRPEVRPWWKRSVVVNTALALAVTVVGGVIVALIA